MDEIDSEIFAWIDAHIETLQRWAADEDGWRKENLEKDIRDLKQIRAKWYVRITGLGPG